MKLTPEQRSKVDELGALDAKISEMTPTVDRAKQLRAEVEGWAEKTPAAAAVSFTGNKYTVLCGPKKNEREVDVAGVRELLGDGFFEIAKVGLGEIDKVGARIPQVLKFVKTTRSGKRTITTAVKAA